MQNAMSPGDVAEQVFKAIRARQFYVITTTGYDDALRDRMNWILKRQNPQFPDIRSMYKRNSKAL